MLRAVGAALDGGRGGGGTVDTKHKQRITREHKKNIQRLKKKKTARFHLKVCRAVGAALGGGRGGGRSVQKKIEG